VSWCCREMVFGFILSLAFALRATLVMLLGVIVYIDEMTQNGTFALVRSFFSSLL
jgi:hypothetical protein